MYYKIRATHLCTYCIPGQTKALPPGTSKGLLWQHPVR